MSEQVPTKDQLANPSIAAFNEWWSMMTSEQNAERTKNLSAEELAGLTLAVRSYVVCEGNASNHRRETQISEWCVMTDPVPSKERFYDRFTKMWYDLIDSAAKHTLRYTRTSILFTEADQEIERLRTALRGIQSCSTCEACRGAATLALRDGCAPIEQVEARKEQSDLVQQMRLAGYHDWASGVERLQRPAHEREPPHCSSCSCGMAPEPCPVPDREFERLVADFGTAISLWTTGGGSRADAKAKAEAVLMRYYRHNAQPPGDG